MHGEGLLDPNGQKKPIAHDVLVTASGQKLPAGHNGQDSELDSPVPGENVPRGQRCTSTEPSGQKLPAEHTMGVDMPLEGQKRPAGHTVMFAELTGQ